MRLLVYFTIVLTAVAAAGARELHRFWPDTSTARFDRLFWTATGLFVLLIALGSADWKRRQLRDWKAWAALVVAACGLLYSMLPLVQ